MNNRSLHNAYYFMHEGIPMIYSDGFNYAGEPFRRRTRSPSFPQANYLGQYRDNQMPEIVYLHHQLARGGTRSRWSDANIVAWERYDYRDVSNGDPFTDSDATVVFFAANNKTSFPGDVSFDDGISRTARWLLHLRATASNSRGYAMKVGFPPGSVLCNLPVLRPGANRAARNCWCTMPRRVPSTATATANDRIQLTARCSSIRLRQRAAARSNC